MSQISGVGNSGSVGGVDSLGTCTSVNFIFAKLQMELAASAKDSALGYIDQIEQAQKDQKEIADMLQQCRQLQADAKTSGGCTTMPDNIVKFMDKNGLAYDKTGNDTLHNKDEWDVAILFVEGTDRHGYPDADGVCAGLHGPVQFVYAGRELGYPVRYADAYRRGSRPVKIPFAGAAPSGWFPYLWGCPFTGWRLLGGTRICGPTFRQHPFSRCCGAVPEELFMTEQKRAAVEYTQEELETMVKAVLNGATIGDVCNVSQDMLESLYSLGYNLYTSGNYKDAETVFSGLCLYDHNDPRFWMGLAGSRQANGKYQEAVDAYGLCSAMGALASPVPLLQAGMCYLKMGDREKAKGAFVVALSMGEEGNPEHDAARGKASAMLAILEQAEK